MMAAKSTRSFSEDEEWDAEMEGRGAEFLGETTLFANWLPVTGLSEREELGRLSTGGLYA
ncbi:hypothetical protein RUND412_003290, partial [Rhizina undulata]